MRLEVRCCCQPQKLLGTVEVPDDTRRGQNVTWVLAPSMLCAKLDEWLSHPEFKVYRRPAETLTLPIQTFVIPPGLATRGESGLAVKAEGVGLETLRKISTFIEAKDGPHQA